MGKKGRVYAAGEEDYEVLCNTPSTSPMASSSIPSSREGVATKGEDHLLEGNMGRKSRTSNASMGGGDPHAHDDELVTKSLWLFTRDNSARIFFMALLKTTWFDKCILATILLNSISLAMVDYSDVDDDYNPIAAGSWRNTLVNYLEPFFTCIFTLEAITKIVALGFTVYIRDGWNRLDFLVVVAGAMELLPGVPKLSMLRTFRILRPLRSLSKFPGLRRVITAMLNSLPGLMDVVLLLCFVLAIFSILGIQFFMGILHSRCRLTPYPVRMAECTSVDAPCWNSYLQEVVADPLSHACLVDSSGQPVPNDSSSWTRKGSSPWAETQDCVWPIDNDDMRICSQFSGGWHQCKAWDDRTCGSDYDSLGNSRFWTVDTPYGFDRMKSGTYYEDLNWGFTNFDNFVAAILSIFQSVTMEGWSTIMYMCMDAYNPIAAAIVFVSVIVLGSFVMLNLVLAVITESISDADETARQEAEAKRQAKIDAGQSLTQRVVPKFPEPKRWQLPLLALIHNSLWSKIIMGFIIANTVVLASDRYPISPEEVRRLETANLVFTIVFAFEMVINMLALGLRQYVSDPFNNFDFVIVVTSLIELTVSAFTDGSGSGGISALRAFRLFRVFKLAKRWKDLQELLAAMQRTVLQVGNFAVLLFLFIFIYALVGLQFFSNRLHFNPQTGAPVSITSPQYASGEIPRANFDTFIWSMVTVFQVLTGENWNSVMYDCWRATSWIAPVYFLSLVILGGFIVMNIFLAILLSNFEGNEDLIPAPEKQSSSERVARVGSAIRFMHRLKEGGIARIRGEKKDESGEAAPLKSESVRDDPESSLTDSESLLGCEDADQARETAGSSRESSEDMDDYVMGNGLLPPAGKRHSASSAVYKAAQVAHNMGRRVSLASHTLVNGIAEVESKVNNQMETAQEDSRSLWMFSTNSSFRSLCTKIVAQKNFENGILYLIILSTIMLALDSPLNDPDSIFVKCLSVLNVIFSTVFFLECFLKIIAYGFMMHKGSYLRSSWNQLDFFIVVVSLLSLFDFGPGSGLKAFRTVRVLRPLRMIGRNPELKIVVDALLSSLPAILNVSVVCVLFFLVFAVMGVTYLKGTFNQCVTDGLSDEQVQYLTYPVTWADATAAYPSSAEWLAGTACEAPLMEGLSVAPDSQTLCACMLGSSAWQAVIPQNFDNVFKAMGTLYEIATTEGWLDVMYAAIDQRGIGMQPVENNQLWWIGFFVLFMIFGSFFIMNLFVGVVIDNFNRIKSSRGAVFMTKEQEEWQKMQRLVDKIKPKRVFAKPLNPWNAACYSIMMRPSFDTFIIWCIILNSIVMAMPYFGQTYPYSLALEWVNYAFALIFTMECIIKISGIGRNYFDEAWNRFDFTIVVGTLAGLVFKFSSGTDVGTVASVIRLFRLGRILRLINSAKSLRQLFNTLITSLPSFANIGGLLFLLFFIYAVLGVQLFAKIASNSDYNAHANFRSFWVALLTLFRFSTGEAWNEFMYSMTPENEPSDCVPDPPFNPNWCETNDELGCQPINGCGSVAVYPYFYSFTLIVTFIMLNLFIGVILDSFSNCDEGDEILTPHDFDIFTEDWAKFDKEGSGYIAVEDLTTFIQILDSPLGFGEEYEVGPDEVRQRILDMRLPVAEGGSKDRVHFMDVAKSLAHGVAQRRFGSTGFMQDAKGPAPVGPGQSSAMPEEAFRQLLAFTVPVFPTESVPEDKEESRRSRLTRRSKAKRRSSDTTPPPKPMHEAEITPPKRSSTLGVAAMRSFLKRKASSAVVLPTSNAEE